MSYTWIFTEYGDARTQQFVDQPAAEPGPGQLSVRVRAAGVNPADIKIRSGEFGRTIQPPRPMGLELSGVVTAVGSGVADFAVGDAILGPAAQGYGAFAEDTLVSVDAVMLKPESLSFAEAATIPIAATAAYDASYQLTLAAGSTVLLTGAGGGVGLIAAQLCRLQQLHVIGVASAQKRELVEWAGATHVAYGPDVDLPGTIGSQASGDVDAMIDLAGGQVWRELASLVRAPQNIVLVADPDPDNGIGAVPVRRTDTALETMVELMGQGAVTTHIGSRYGLENADVAIADVEAGHSAGKVVLTRQ